VVLDAELVCLADDGKPDFAALRRRLAARGRTAAQKASEAAPAMLMVFDLLHLDGRAVRELPYGARRDLLAELSLDGPAWQTPAHFVGRAAELGAATADQDLEGIVAKRLDSPWTPGRRTAHWVKSKHRRRERLVITGWRERSDAPEEFLVARQRPDGKLVPAGAVSLGLAAAQRADLLDVLAAQALPRRRRGGIRLSTTLVEATVDSHGRPDGPVRDAVMRELHLRNNA
jgi:bifunctional non-homologous end joining protein LigD